MFTFKNTFNLCDGWRQTFPDTLEYSFLQKATGSQSRLDRILVPFSSLLDLTDWEMSEKTLVGETLQEKIYGLERKRHMCIRDNSAAGHWLEAETTVTDFWTKTDKPNAPRDTLRTPQIPGSNPPEYVTRSDEMAKIVRDYHEHLQVEDLASEADQDAVSAKCFESMTIIKIR
jgi:hypothetical protein